MDFDRLASQPLIVSDLVTLGQRIVAGGAAFAVGRIEQITERIHKLEDAGAIRGYTVVVDPEVFGLGINAHVRMRAMPGEVRRLAQMLIDTPEVVEADRVTGEDCFLVKVVVSDVRELEIVIDRFLPFSSADIAIIQSSTVVRRLPKL